MWELFRCAAGFFAKGIDCLWVMMVRSEGCHAVFFDDRLTRRTGTMVWWLLLATWSWGLGGRVFNRPGPWCVEPEGRAGWE
jgi:hypothetical protein